jgi:hypothetical protein
MKFRIIASLVVLAVLIIGYFVYQANSNSSAPQPQDNQGIRIN